jgi:hypothetical protein
VTAQPALIDTLRAAEEALGQALAHIRAQAPSPLPAGWHMAEPQWAIRNAHDRVKRKLDQHLC